MSLPALLWTGSRAFAVIVRAIQAAFMEDETRPWWHRTLREVALLLTLGVLFGAVLALRLVVVAAWAWLGWGDATSIGLQATISVARLVVLMVALLGLYRFVPCECPHPLSVAFGAAVATLALLVAQLVFVRYTSHFGSYKVLYGSVATAVLGILWIWLLTLIVIFGGHVAALTEAHLAAGRPLAELYTAQRARSIFRAVPRPALPGSDEA